MNNKKPFYLHVIKDEPGIEPLKAILPDDGTMGFVIGEDWEIRLLYDLIGEYLQNGKHDGDISNLHEQLGSPWFTIREASEYANDRGENIPERTIRWAASHGFIHEAEKQGRDWRMPRSSLIIWMNHRPKQGRK